jgi:hypothetical protein
MTVLRLSDSTDLPLAATPQQTTAGESIEGVTGRTVFKDIQVTPSETLTAESVLKLVSDTSKTSTIKIVTDSTVVGTYSNLFLVGGVTLDTTLKFTLAQRTTAEIESKEQGESINSMEVAYELMDSALAASEV